MTDDEEKEKDDKVPLLDELFSRPAVSEDEETLGDVLLGEDE